MRFVSFDSSLERFPELLAEQRQRRHTDPDIRRHMAVVDHLLARRAACPEWHGPRVGTGPEGYCQVFTAKVWNQSRNLFADHQGARCRVLSVSHSRETITAVIEEGPFQGEMLRLDTTEVWLPEWLFCPAVPESSAVAVAA